METNLNENKIFENQEKFGKKVVEYCKPFKGYHYYSIVMKAIEFGYQLAQKELETESVQEEKTSWSREEIVALIQKLEKDGADYFGQAFLEQWIEENL